MSLKTNDGVDTPRVGLGCMGMSEFYGRTDDAESLRALHRAFELGYRHFDTADMYGSGHNEQLLGRFLKELGSRRSSVFVATKCGIRRKPGPTPAMEIDSSPAYVKRACEASLGRLGVESLDLLYLHRRSAEVPIEDTVAAMAELVAAGKIRNVGLSEVSELTLRAASAVHPIAALQSEYSLWTRDAEQGVLQAASELGIAFVAYSPLGRGFLTGALTQSTIEASQDLRRHLPRFAPGNFDANRALLTDVEAVALEAGCSSAQVALAWVLAQGSFVHIIPGARKTAHVEANFASQQVVLSASQLARLSHTFAPRNVQGARYPEALLSTVNL